MDRGRPQRLLRKSPTRYSAEAPKRDRSRSRGRRPKSFERELRKSEVPLDSPKSEITRRKSPGRKPKTSKSPGRRKTAEEKEIKKSSPAPSIESKSIQLEEIIRTSFTPDRARSNEIFRSSVSRFEEIIAEDAPSMRHRSTRAFNTKIYSSDVGGDRFLEYMTRLSEQKELLKDNELKATNAVNNNTKNYHIPNNSREFGGPIGALALILFMPLLVIAAQIFCTQENCLPVPTKVVLTFKRFFDLEASLWYIAFIFGQLLLTSVPLGFRLYGVGSKGFGLAYWRNGPASLFLTISFLAGLEYYFSFPVLKLLDKTMPFLTTAILFGLALTILLYCFTLKESNYGNPFAQTGNVIYDLWMGKEIHPRFGPFDLKISLIRSSLISIIIYNGLLLLKEVQTKSDPADYSTMLLTICSLEIFLALDLLIFESSLISSFFVAEEGTGYNLIMTLAVLPFWITLIPKYLYFSKPDNNWWFVGLTVLLHFFGHIIYRISCYQHDNFLRNPTSFKSSGVLYSRHSEKLFKGGLRSIVRYPEYSGLLLIVFAWCLGCTLVSPLHWIPPSVLILTITSMILHTRRLDSRSKAKYNLIWNSYISNTSSAIIPYIY